MENQIDQQADKAPKEFFTTKMLMALVFVVCTFLFGFSAGKKSVVGGSGQTVISGQSSGGRVDFDLFWKAWDVLGKRYVDQESLNPEDMLYGAINGMFASTGDPYTTFFDPEINKAFSDDLGGSFEGIGAEIGLRDNFLTIISPLDNSPAQKAGLRAGDRVIKIDGEIISDISIEDAVKKIRGDRGSEVVLTIFRDGDNDTRDIVVVRDTIVIESVTYEVEGDIAIIRVSQFGTDTDRDFRKALGDLQRQGVERYIIDMRNNPGGILGVAVQMIGNFVPRDSVAVIEESSGGKQDMSRTTGSPILSEGAQIVILINQGSASASEIFAAALKSNLPDSVTLLGETTFGKGSVQELIPMKGGTAAKITIAKWLTPDSEQIDKVGIDPDVTVEYTNEDFDADRDPQLDAAKEVLRGTYVPPVDESVDAAQAAADALSDEVEAASTGAEGE